MIVYSGFPWKFAFVQNCLFGEILEFFYLYIINTRVSDNTFFHVQGLSCLSS